MICRYSVDIMYLINTGYLLNIYSLYTGYLWDIYIEGIYKSGYSLPFIGLV